MDVRCEKCKTEYELDENKLKPGGVTVKCTSCGHMFKIRKRSPTNVGIPTGNHAAQRPPRAASSAPPRAASSGPPPVMQAAAVESGPIDAGTKRKWLIKLENGETKTCRELATLQQWIVAGLVTRTCLISRSGAKWKQLGEIDELSKFFAVADEARRARAQRASSSSGPVPTAPAPAPARSVPAAAPESPTMLSGPPNGASHSPLPLQPPRASSSGPIASPTPAPKPAAPRASDAESRSTGNWAVDAKLNAELEDAGPSGPIGGLAKGIPTDDVAFAGGKIAPLRTGFADKLEPGYDDDDEFFAQRSGGGAGKWIVIGSLVVIAAAVALVYLFVFRDSEQTQAATEDSVQPTDQVVDAGVVAEAPPPDAAVDMSTSDGVLEAVPATIFGDVGADLEKMATKLSEIPDGDNRLPVLVARARIHAALAQHLTDDADAASKKEARTIKKKVKAEVNEGLAAVNKALKLDKNDAAANIVMADLMRLQGKRRSQVDRYLKKHYKAGEYEARYVDAMTLLRDKRRKKAVEELGALKAEGEPDVRPSYRLAHIAFGDKDYDTARAEVDRVVEAQPEHPGASALIDRIEAATEVVKSDPMPPEDRGSSGGGGDSYDRLVSKADKAAEAGRCGSAIKLYKQAINKSPSGVAALTGLGYCYIETKQFASAHRQFQIALGLSPRYVPALWGVAEAYQQQGRGDLAIKAYKKYLELHPNGGRAAAAKRQIEKLGGSVGAPPDDPPPDDPPPDDPPPDDPPPDDPPPDDPPPDDPPDDDPPDNTPPDDPAPDPVPESPPPDPDPEPGPDGD